MSLNPELQALNSQKASYRGDPEKVGDRLKGKTLVMVGGPTKVGKTTLIQRATEILPGAVAVPSIVDRERKLGDPVDYLTASEGVTQRGLIKAIHERRLVNYDVHPAGNIYATDTDGYSGTFNFLPTMMHEEGLAQLRNAGFDSTITAYVLMPGGDYKKNVGKDDFRGKRAARMQEAISSLSYAAEHIDEIEFIENRMGNGGLEMAASSLATIANGVTSPVPKDRALDLIEQMTEQARKLAN